MRPFLNDIVHLLPMQPSRNLDWRSMASPIGDLLAVVPTSSSYLVSRLQSILG